MNKIIVGLKVKITSTYSNNNNRVGIVYFIYEDRNFPYEVYFNNRLRCL